MTIQENWALSTARIEDYLQGLGEVREIAASRYQVGGCEILLQPAAESRVEAGRVLSSRMALALGSTWMPARPESQRVTFVQTGVKQRSRTFRRT